MSTENVARLLETYEAFVAGRLGRIPELFQPEGRYLTSGVFPGMQDSYVGHEEIEMFWYSATEAWEWFEVEPKRTAAHGDCVVAEVELRGSGAGSGVEVTIAAGHLVRFRDGLIVEFSAYGTWEEALADAGPALARAAGEGDHSSARH